MKKDRIANLLRRKCSRLELNIYRLTIGARTLLRVRRNRGDGAEQDTNGGQCELRRVLHGRGSSLLSRVCQSNKDMLGRTFCFNKSYHGKPHTTDFVYLPRRHGDTEEGKSFDPEERRERSDQAEQVSLYFELGSRSS